MGWKTEYKRALVLTVLKAGTPVSRGGHMYGWIADDYDERRTAVREALASGALDPLAVHVEEAEWREFGDTDSDGVQRHGVDLFFDLDGERERWRYDGSVGALILELLNDRED